MATLSKPVGYEYEFVDQVPEDYFCKLCKHVAREPTIASCCTEILCKVCIDVIVQDKKPCPSCESSDLKALGLHVKYQRKILALEVRCTMKDRGCPWTGQLQHLDAHLDVTTGDCQYVDVECPNKCDQKVQKCNVDTHLANECPSRDYRCPHCNFTDTFQVVSDHFEVCRYYPLACPNRCGVTFERDDLPDHMKMCRLEEVQCVFSSEGCQSKFIRDNEDKHMDQNTQKHIAMMPAATLRISQDFEQKLQEQQEVFEKKLEQKDKEHKQGIQQLGEQLKEQVKQKNEQIKVKQETLERKLQEQQEVFEKKTKQQKEEHEQKQTDRQTEEMFDKKLEEQIKLVEQKLDKQSREFEERLGRQQNKFQETLKEKDTQIKALEEQLQVAVNQIRKEVGTSTYDITFSNYTRNKTKGWFIDSSPMYTHPGKYKFDLRIFPNDWSRGDGTHVCVAILPLEGDHDAVLKFPAKFIITVQLLNQHRDQDHHSRDIQCEVTRKKIATPLNIGTDLKFIPHTALEWNRDKQTQYLKDDCLKFRITKIVAQ